MKEFESELPSLIGGGGTRKLTIPIRAYILFLFGIEIENFFSGFQQPADCFDHFFFLQALFRRQYFRPVLEQEVDAAVRKNGALFYERQP